MCIINKAIETESRQVFAGSWDAEGMMKIASG